MRYELTCDAIEDGEPGPGREALFGTTPQRFECRGEAEHYQAQLQEYADANDFRVTYGIRATL